VTSTTAVMSQKRANLSLGRLGQRKGGVVLLEASYDGLEIRQRDRHRLAVRRRGRRLEVDDVPVRRTDVEFPWHHQRRRQGQRARARCAFDDQWAANLVDRLQIGGEHLRIVAVEDVVVERSHRYDLLNIPVAGGELQGDLLLIGLVVAIAVDAVVAVVRQQ
jgi:hypothetical protein